MSSYRSVHVLHVDDNEPFTEVVKSGLEREREEFELISETDPEVALTVLDEQPIDCIVSDYEMPTMDGVTFLKRVRDRYPALPFILFTGKGTEEVASQAISAGVTDYLQKSGGMEQFTVLANRIENAVEQREYERQFQTLVNNVPGIVYRGKNTPTWDFDFVGGEVKRLTGYTPREIVEGNVSWSPDVIHEADQEQTWQVVQDHFERNEPFEVTYRIITKDGECKWVWERGQQVDVDGSGTEILEGFITDITDQKVQEAALKLERERFTTLFEHFPEPTIAYYYDEEPHIHQANEAFVETFAGDTDIVDAAVNDLIVPDDRLEKAQDIDRRTREGELLDEVLKRQTVDGERYFRFRDIPIEDDETIDGFAVYTDIHEQKVREGELERQNERLEEFASFVSHDLRNPLNVAQIHLELIGREYDGDYYGEVEHSLERMEEMIESLLTIAHHGDAEGEQIPIDLAAFVDRCWKTVDGPTATIECESASTIRANEGRLAAILENLFRNAIDHGGADVTITVGELPDRTGIFVEDDGEGLPDSHSGDIFESGYSTTPEGTGFGLAIVRKVVDAQGWDIRATESVSGGARFEITGIDFVQSG